MVMPYAPAGLRAHLKNEIDTLGPLLVKAGVKANQGRSQGNLKGPIGPEPSPILREPL